jgi:hypothetical protein
MRLARQLAATASRARTTSSRGTDALNILEVGNMLMHIGALQACSHGSTSSNISRVTQALAPLALDPAQ